jgi:transcriptional regulator with XRE-family HTH domain
MSQVFDSASTPADPLWLRLMVARRRAGLKQYELAQRVGVSSALLSRIETGLKEPDADLLARLSEVLGVDLAPAEATA